MCFPILLKLCAGDILHLVSQEKKKAARISATLYAIKRKFNYTPMVFFNNILLVPLKLIEFPWVFFLKTP